MRAAAGVGVGRDIGGQNLDGDVPPQSRIAGAINFTHGAGIYRNGKVELLEPLVEAEGSRVIVTWVHPAEPVDLRERGIDEHQAVDLRRRLAPFAEDWDRSEMAAYDELPPRC
jgi:hypothetical protein